MFNRKVLLLVVVLALLFLTDNLVDAKRSKKKKKDQTKIKKSKKSKPVAVAVEVDANGDAISKPAMAMVQKGSDGDQRPLFIGYDDALPQERFDNLLDEARAYHKFSMKGGNFKHGKRPTVWLDLDPVPQPRSYIEQAILLLRSKAQEEMFSHRPDDTILGAEWWVQVRDGDEDIGFHYDKDEAMASEQGKMKHPLVSTVTYLTDIGAPTLIFDQITIDGNKEVPEIPYEAYLSYPKANRHVTFSGDLQHGVLGSAAPKESGTKRKGKQARVTLLINWWEVKPLEPNTIVLSDKDAKKQGLYSLGKKIEEASSSILGSISSALGLGEEVEVGVDGTKAHNLLAVEKLEIPENLDSDATRHELTLPPGDLFFIYLPTSDNLGAVGSGVHKIEWGRDQVYGFVGMLDLTSQNQVGSLFRMQEPKVLLMYDDSKDKKTYNKLLKSILPLAKKYVGSVKVYFCPTSSCADAMGAFGVQKDDLPKMVIDDTHVGKKHVQKKFTTKAASIEKWWKKKMDLEGKEYLHK